jgi:probable rRNA maturation factor
VKITFAAFRAPVPRAESLARRGVRAALAAHRPVARGELNIVWTTRDELRALNRQFRRKNLFTDVIAFRHGDSSAEGRFPLGGAEGGPFGDLYIAVDQARANARRFGVPFDEEIVRLSTHGTLHLLGYTDYTPVEKAKMWAIQEPIVRSVMRARPSSR